MSQTSGREEEEEETNCCSAGGKRDEEEKRKELIAHWFPFICEKSLQQEQMPPGPQVFTNAYTGQANFI